VPLTPTGRGQAKTLGTALRERHFALVLTSPLERARETCRLAGLGDSAQQWSELAEWDYGAYEGLTSAEIRANRPAWTLWRDGVPEGETVAQVGARADRVVERLRAVNGTVAVFAHGHLLRVLAARWLGLPPGDGRLFMLDPASVSIVGYEHEAAAIRLWNMPVLGAARGGP
jgi:probable phosphoglycerate mutase